MFRNSNVRYVILLLVLSMLIWIPRFRGPIDLGMMPESTISSGHRWPKGRGIGPEQAGRGSSHSVSATAPRFVAFHQWALGTSDLQSVGQWSRITSAIIFSSTSSAYTFWPGRTHPGLFVPGYAHSNHVC